MNLPKLSKPLFEYIRSLFYRPVVCKRCHRVLKDKKSIEREYGRKCWEKRTFQYPIPPEESYYL